MTTLIIQIAVVLIIAYSVLGWSLFFFQSRLLYWPTRDVTYTPDEIDIEYENITFETLDGIKLNGWFIPEPNAKYTVLFCHGSGGNISHRLDTINILKGLGLNCFLFDYRGYGNSEGKLSEEGTYKDSTAAYEWLTKTKKIESENIIVFGRSLGGPIAANLASKKQVGGLVLESTFTSFVDIGKRFYPYMPVKWFARFRYETINYIREVNCPVLVIHSSNDGMIPFEFGQELFEAANKPKQFAEIYGGHNDGFLLSNDIYIKAWKDWLKSEMKFDAPDEQNSAG